MKSKKAIERTSLIYIITMFLITTASLLVINNELHSILLIIQLILLILPLLFIILKSKDKTILISNILFIIFLLGIFTVSFKWLRDVSPNPVIGRDTSIGYAQYFGYPLYLDTYIFFILILSPVLFFIFIKFKNMFISKEKNDK